MESSYAKLWSHKFAFLPFHNLDIGFPPVDLGIDHEEGRVCPNGISFSHPRPTMKAEGWVGELCLPSGKQRARKIMNVAKYRFTILPATFVYKGAGQLGNFKAVFVLEQLSSYYFSSMIGFD